MQSVKHATMIVAALSGAVFVVSVLCWKLRPTDFEEIAPVQDILNSLKLASTKALHEDANFREEQLNKLRMLKKRFDGIETSISKIDVLEQAVERIEKALGDFERAGLAVNNPLSKNMTSQECQFDEIKGLWTPSWKWINNGCKTELEASDIERCEQSLQKIAFLGDSQMYHLFRTFIRSMYARTCTEIKAGGRCNQLQSYFGLQPVSADKLVTPNPDLLEGPNGYGKEFPGCTDCSGCDAGLLNCSGAFGSSSLLMEYVPLEFAKDYELQSTEAQTTQENVAIYLSRSKIKPSVVIFNVGLHDSQVLEDGRPDTVPMTPENYVKTCDFYQKNLVWFVSVLKKHLPDTDFVFLTTSPKNRKYYIVNDYANPMIEHMNGNARDIMRANGFGVVDVYPLIESDEAKTLFSDEVHFHEQGGAYYKTVRQLIMRQVCKIVTHH